MDVDDIDLSQIGTQKLGDMIIEVIDPITDYIEMLQNIEIS